MQIGQGLFLVFSLPLAALLVGSFVPRRFSWGVTTAAVAGSGAGAVALMSTLALRGAQTFSLGWELPFGPIALRADTIGMVLAVVSSVVATVVIANSSERSRTVEMGLITCYVGCILTACAARLGLLAIGCEVVVVGGVMIAGVRSSGISRGTWWVVGAIQLGILCLMGTALFFQSTVGSSTFEDIHGANVGQGVVWVWSVGTCVVLLFSAALVCVGTSRWGIGWSVFLGVSALASIVRMESSMTGEMPPALQGVLAVVGSLISIGAVVIGWRGHARLPVVVAALCVALAGNVIALIGFSVASPVACVIASLALIVALGMSPAAFVSGWRAAWVVMSIGGMPFGVGATALFVELSLLAANRGIGGTLLFCTASVVALGCACVSVRGAKNEFRRSTTQENVVGRTAMAYAAVSLFAALVPGLVVWFVSQGVRGAAGIDPVMADVGVVKGASSTWAGGYLTLSFVCVLAAVLSALYLGGAHIVDEPHGTMQEDERSALLPRVLIVYGRLVVRPSRHALRLFGAMDTWFLSQPRIPLVIGAGVGVVLLGNVLR